MSELCTQRLRLDGVRPSDADDVLEHCSDPTLQEFVPVHAVGAVPHRDERLDGWFASLLRDDDRAPHDGWPV